MDPFSAMALIGAGGTLVSNIWNSAEAARNRRFQERMSSSAHQREVADLRAAGINPMLSRMGSGSSTPGGDRAQMEDIGKSAFSAAQLSLLKKQAALLTAQEQKTVAETQGLQTINMERFSGVEPRLAALRSASDLAGLSVEEKRRLLPFAVKRAEAEIKQTLSSAEAMRARAYLDELDSVRALNEAEFEKLLGEASPALRAVLLIVRSLR